MTDFKVLAHFKGLPVRYRMNSNKLMEMKILFDVNLIRRIKDMGFSWKEREKIWRGELNVMSAWQIGRLFPEAKPLIHSFDILPKPSKNGWVPSPYLMEHQKRGAAIAKERPRHCFWHETGTGKTVLSIEIWKQKRVKTLVVCPLSIIEGAWIEDIRKFAPDCRTANLWRLNKRRGSKTKPSISGRIAFDQTLKTCDIGIVNFDSFKGLRQELEAAGFRMLIVDESSFIKNYRAAVTKDISKFADTMWYVYLLSGTPAPNSDMEFFSQIRLVDPFLFGRSFYFFKMEWFRQTDFAGFRWGLKSDMKDEFKRRVAKVSDYVNKHDVLDLPERTYNIRKIYLSPAEERVYKEMARKMVTEIDEQEIEAANAAVKVMKLREVTSGFLFDEDKNVKVFGDSKLKELKILLEEIGGKPVVIWIQFQPEAAMIMKFLQDKAVLCNSSVSTARQADHIRDFKAGKVQYLVAHPKSVGHGHTLTHCSDAVYYSLSYSYEQQTQSADRIYRYGAKNTCSYYFLLADETIDEAIYRTLFNKEARLTEVLDHVKQFK